MKGKGTSGALATAVVAAAAIGLWLATGVEADEIARYLGYELAFVIAPGWLLFRAISPATCSRLTQLAIGWPLGLVAEIAFFSLTAAFDARDLFYAYPAFIGVPAAIVWWRRSRVASPAALGRDARVEATSEAARPPAVTFTPAQIWTIAGLCLVAFAYLGLTLIAQSPIPGSVDNVSYLPDSMWHISIAAEAKHHWPLESPQVAGVALHYHYFAHLHIAATSQVTGIEIPIVYLRLYLLPLTALMLLQLSLLGRALSRIGWVGPLTAAFCLLVSEIDLSILGVAPFFGVKGIWLWASPSYTFGLVFFVPIVMLLAGLVQDRVLDSVGLRRDAAVWVLLALLLLGAGGAKVVDAPLAASGLSLYVLWTWRRQGRWSRPALAAFALSTTVFLAYVAFLYGTEGGGIGLGIGATYGFMPALATLDGVVSEHWLADGLFWAFGSVATTVLLFGAPLAGLYWIFTGDRAPLRPEQRLLLCILAVSLLAWVFLDDDFGNTNYFSAYGLVAVSPLAAEGIFRGSVAWRQQGNRSIRLGVVMLAVWLALCLGLAMLGWQLELAGHPARAYGLAYGGLGLLFLGCLLFARVLRLGGQARIGLVAIALASAATLDLVLDTVPDSVKRVRNDLPLYDNLSFGLTRADYAAAVWMREHLPDDAVMVVSNQRSDRARMLAPVHTEIPAFTERRGFYEGWAYAIRTLEIGWQPVVEDRKYPYKHRRELENRLLYHADAGALSELTRKYAVTHVVVDHDDGDVASVLWRRGRVVFSNQAVAVIEL